MNENKDHQGLGGFYHCQPVGGERGSREFNLALDSLVKTVAPGTAGRGPSLITASITTMTSFDPLPLNMFASCIALEYEDVHDWRIHPVHHDDKILQGLRW